jgi:hypothetical protein
MEKLRFYCAERESLRATGVPCGEPAASPARMKHLLLRVASGRSRRVFRLAAGAGDTLPR